MFCPRCEYQYMVGITTCPDCQTALVEKKPNTIGAAVIPDDSWIEVCGVQSNSRAEAAKRALDASNIPSVVLSERFMADHAMAEAEYADPGMLTELSIIMVPREFLDDAEMVVEVALGDDFISLDDE